MRNTKLGYGGIQYQEPSTLKKLYETEVRQQFERITRS